MRPSGTQLPLFDFVKLPVQITVSYTHLDVYKRQEKDEIRFMKGWKLKALDKIMPAWQRRQCEEIRR